ncbi:MAG: hypothetical protein QW112_02520, partial [Candidatus Micrarchaeia archaeon]
VNFNGTEAEWIHFHEEFGNDDYLQGPRIRADTSYGICTIKIYSNESHAKYSLAIGEREEFSPDGILNTIILMPKIKSDFFGKSPFTAFFNPIGLFIFGPVILAVLLFLFLVWICRGMKHRNTDETQKTQK